LSLRYSIYKVQSLGLTAEARLSYHTQFHLSRTFFKFFQISLSRFDSVVCVTSRRLEHLNTSDFICQELFSNSFHFLFDMPFFLSPPRTASVYYHLYHYLSIPFFCLFLIFFILGIKAPVSCLFFLYSAAQNPSGSWPWRQIAHVQTPQ